MNTQPNCHPSPISKRSTEDSFTGEDIVLLVKDFVDFNSELDVLMGAIAFLYIPSWLLLLLLLLLTTSIFIFLRHPNTTILMIIKNPKRFKRKGESCCLGSVFDVVDEA
jgi:hypothetical protein